MKGEIWLWKEIRDWNILMIWTIWWLWGQSIEIDEIQAGNIGVNLIIFSTITYTHTNVRDNPQKHHQSAINFIMLVVSIHLIITDHHTGRVVLYNRPWWSLSVTENSVLVKTVSIVCVRVKTVCSPSRYVTLCHAISVTPTATCWGNVQHGRLRMIETLTVHIVSAEHGAN